MFRTVSYNIVQLGFLLDSPRALGLKVVALQAKLFMMSLNTASADKYTKYFSLVFFILKTSAALQLVVCPGCFMCEVEGSALFQAHKISPFCKDFRSSAHSPC